MTTTLSNITDMRCTAEVVELSTPIKNVACID